jgi:hypothetical protein
MDLPMPPPGHEQTVAAVAACGVPAASVRIAYADELHSDVVTISASVSTDEARLRCVKQAVHPNYFVSFDDEVADGAYQRLVMAEATRWAVVEARRRLRARGLLQGMPRYRPGKGRLAQFVRDVEAHCSVKRGSAVEILSPTSVTLRVKFMQSMLSSANPSHGDRLTCLMNVLTASNLAEGGVDFVFFGNEAVVTKDNEH